VFTPNGVPLADVTIDAVRAGRIDSAEIRATPATLRLQSEVARAAGRVPLAESLERAAELAAVPDDLLLAVYTALRPRRATAAELEDWAARLEGHGAVTTAAFVREAATAYGERGLLADA
jgi:propanediol dehydratase small subunit